MRIAICDDNKDSIAELSMLCKRIDGVCGVLYFHDGSELISYYRNNEPAFDIIILDIYMPIMDGITTAKKIRTFDQFAEIIFFTASKDHAVQAFDYNPVHYFVKPLNANIMTDTITQIISQRKNRELAIITPHSRKKDRIRISDIKFIKKIKETKHLEIYMVNKASVVFSRTTMKEMMNLLPHDIFIMTDQSFIVNLFYVTRFDKDARLLYLDSIDVIPIARQRIKSVSEALARAAIY